MELGAIFLLFALLLAVGAYLYLPFTRRARRMRPDESLQASALKAERDRIINALQELDFDHRLGKIPSEDYPEQRAALLRKGAEVLRLLDEIAPAASASGNAETRIEQAAEAVRADSSAKPAAPALEDDDLEAMLAARRKQRKEKSAGFCPKCGKTILVSDKFCPACGKSL
ncbi:MAG: hypothetical protein Fur002_13490 [Anaerolineales bacterium]